MKRKVNRKSVKKNAPISNDNFRGIDLFEDYENIPPRINAIIERYQDLYDEDLGGMDYKDTARMLEEFEQQGYTFGYGLDNQPYGLRPIGVRLNQLQGFEEFGDDEYALGGEVMKKDLYEVGDKIKYMDTFRREENDGTIYQINELGTYIVSTGMGVRGVQKEEVIGVYPKEEPKKKRFGLFAEGGETPMARHGMKTETIGASGSKYKVELWKSFEDMREGERPYKIVYSLNEQEIRDLAEENDGASKLYQKRKGKYNNFSTYLEKGGQCMYGLGGRVDDIDSEISSNDLKEELREKMKDGDDVIHFAYTDYGGDFLDKVAIEYFEENYPKNIVSEDTAYSGKNAFVFGKPATEWLEASQNYLLGFDDIESYYYERQNEEEYKGYNDFLKDLRMSYVFDKKKVLDWLMENRSGYYSITTQGLDYSTDDLIEVLENEGLIKKSKEYGGGGETPMARNGMEVDDLKGGLKNYYVQVEYSGGGVSKLIVTDSYEEAEKFYYRAIEDMDYDEIDYAEFVAEFNNGEKEIIDFEYADAEYKSDDEYGGGGETPMARNGMEVKNWSASDVSNAKYLGILEFEDTQGELHNFEVMETEDRLVFGGMTNSGFIESGYIEKDGRSTDETLDNLVSDLDVYYTEGVEYTSEIVVNQRMANGGTFGGGGSIAEGNYHMILSQAKEVQHHVDELQDILKKEDDIEAWVVAKMENVSSTLSDVTHYLDGKSEMPMAKRGMKVDKIEYPSISLKEKDLNDDQTEIYAYIESRQEMQKQYDTIRKNLMTKIARGEFDETKAPKVFMYLVENGLKLYSKNFSEIKLSKQEKEEIANNMVVDFMSEAELGNYENETFLPKKYLAENGMVVMTYDIYDEDGQLEASGLVAQDVIDYANLRWYYDMMDEDGEEIDDFDVARDYLEQDGFNIESHNPEKSSSATKKRKIIRKMKK